MKVLFLDIDGVINCASTNFKSEYWPLDRYMAFMVGKIVLDTDCQVVLSSSWRHHPEGMKEVEKRVCKLLDRTGNDPKGFRGNEIKEWLSNHSEVTKYAILDDDSDFLPDQPLFKTSWQTGLTEEIMKEVINHLNS
jgi:hypothetical protein